MTIFCLGICIINQSTRHPLINLCLINITQPLYTSPSPCDTYYRKQLAYFHLIKLFLDLNGSCSEIIMGHIRKHYTQRSIIYFGGQGIDRIASLQRILASSSPSGLISATSFKDGQRGREGASPHLRGENLLPPETKCYTFPFLSTLCRRKALFTGLPAVKVYYFPASYS